MLLLVEGKGTHMRTHKRTQTSEPGVDGPDSLLIVHDLELDTHALIKLAEPTLLAIIWLTMLCTKLDCFKRSRRLENACMQHSSPE